MPMLAPPPMVAAPAPIASRNVMVWGDEQAMENMRADFENAGWTWAKLLLGGETEALVLIPPAHVPDAAVVNLINEINSGKHGMLNAGNAQFAPGGNTKLKTS